MTGRETKSPPLDGQEAGGGVSATLLRRRDCESARFRAGGALVAVSVHGVIPTGGGGERKLNSSNFVNEHGGGGH